MVVTPSRTHRREAGGVGVFGVSVDWDGRNRQGDLLGGWDRTGVKVFEGTITGVRTLLYVEVVMDGGEGYCEGDGAEC